MKLFISFSFCNQIHQNSTNSVAIRAQVEKAIPQGFQETIFCAGRDMFF